MELTPILITGIVFLTLYKIIYIFATRKERINLIDKIDRLSGLSVDPAFMQSVRSLFSSDSGSATYTALRWGMAAIGAGLGIIVGVFIAQIPGLDTRYMDETIIGASFFLFTGLALVIAFMVEYRLRRQKCEKSE